MRTERDLQTGQDSYQLGSYQPQPQPQLQPQPQPPPAARPHPPPIPRSASRAAPRKPRQRRTVILVAVGVGGVIVTLISLLAAGVFSQGSMTVHGTEQVLVNSFDGMDISTAFPDITAGSEVTVVDPSGKVIGSSYLVASDPTSWGPQDAVYSFTVTVPDGESRYGIEIGHNRGTAWFSARQMRAGPALSVSG
jgi:hypothetical protein